MKTKFQVGDYLITKVKSSLGQKGSIFRVNSILIDKDGIYYQKEGVTHGLSEDKVAKITYEIVEDK